jgi:Holliday junction resolvase-like predicted endonuclease
MSRKHRDSNDASRVERKQFADRSAARERPAPPTDRGQHDRNASQAQPRPANSAASPAEKPAAPAGLSVADAAKGINPGDVDRAFDASIGGSGVSAEYQTTEALKQGLAGERLAAESLAQQGHQILDYKPDIKGTNQGGIDIVTIKDGTVYFVDNKAYGTGRNVGSVSALEKNFDKNVKAVLEKFEKFAKDPARTQPERDLYKTAVEAIHNKNYLKAVTTAAVVPDGKAAQDISGGLRGREFIHLKSGPKQPSPSMESQVRVAPGADWSKPAAPAENGFRPVELPSRNTAPASGGSRSQSVPCRGRERVSACRERGGIARTGRDGRPRRVERHLASVVHR